MFRRPFAPAQGKTSVRQIRLLFPLLVALSACAPGRGLPPLPSADTREYRLGAGDAVRIITFGEDSLTGEFRVGDSGMIALPLVGPVRAAGANPAELEARVSAALKRSNLLRNPSVAVEVIAYRPIYVLGEVNRPGQYPYQPGMTVVTAAAVAGGFTYRAIDSYASVVRNTGGESMEGKATRHASILPGDVITIFERRF